MDVGDIGGADDVDAYRNDGFRSVCRGVDDGADGGIGRVAGVSVGKGAIGRLSVVGILTWRVVGNVFARIPIPSVSNVESVAVSSNT